MRPRYGINGRFLTRLATGVDRYAREIVRELDSIIEYGEAVLVLPKDSKIEDPIPLRNIELIRFGKRSGYAWEQLEFASYLREKRLLGVNLCNTAPLRNPGVVCIHDMAVVANPRNFNWRFLVWYRIMYAVLVKRAEKIVTVSSFSKKEAERYYPAVRGKIEVIPNAWQHMTRVKADKSILARKGLISHEYYFAMSSLAPNKNLKWIAETARLNPENTFVIAGGINQEVFGKNNIPKTDNVVYMGYVTDGEAKALMESCKAFLFPTFYEGFGIPPMEAIACGVPAIVSDTEVMHEVYGDSVVYVNPAIPEKNLKTLLGQSVTPATNVLGRFSWSGSARLLAEVLEACL